MTDVFREVRERVSAQDAARHYGLTFDRRGWALCPFHADKHPSMSFHKGRFRCWVCDVGGDSIDLTARLLGLDAMGAVERLNADFALALPLHRKPTQAEAQQARRRLEVAGAHNAFEEWRSEFINRLNAAFREGHLLLLEDDLDMGRLTDGQAVAIRMHETFEHWSDALMFRDARGTSADIPGKEGYHQVDRQSFESLMESGAFGPSGPFCPGESRMGNAYPL